MLAMYSNEAQRSLTGFGEIPNDFDAVVDLQTYTPVRQGWYVGIPVTGGLGEVDVKAVRAEVARIERNALIFGLMGGLIGAAAGGFISRCASAQPSIVTIGATTGGVAIGLGSFFASRRLMTAESELLTSTPVFCKKGCTPAEMTSNPDCCL